MDAAYLRLDTCLMVSIRIGPHQTSIALPSRHCLAMLTASISLSASNSRRLVMRFSESRRLDRSPSAPPRRVGTLLDPKSWIAFPKLRKTYRRFC